jgi:hypothetical protein
VNLKTEIELPRNEEAKGPKTSAFWLLRVMGKRNQVRIITSNSWYWFFPSWFKLYC